LTLTASSRDNSKRKNTAALAVLLSLSGLLLFGFGGMFIWTKFFRNKGAPNFVLFSPVNLSMPVCVKISPSGNPGRFQSTRRLASFDSSNPLYPVQARNMEDESSQSNGLMDVTLFDMATISLSTANFATSSKLGEGGFGAVYKVNTAILHMGI
jgi:hypothetical protein